MGGSALASTSIGSAGHDLVEACPLERSPLPAEPPPVPGGETAIAVALSGGGFRATLAGMGVVRFLADAGLLPRVRYMSSVSGGSVANGLIARGWPAIAEGGYTREAFDRHALAPLIETIASRSLERKILSQAWKLVGPVTRTQLLRDAFEDWWFDEQHLAGLPEGVRWVFNAANVTTGARFGFERDVVGDYVIGRVPTERTTLRLAEAVASSAAVPGVLAPYVIKGIDFPCLGDREVKLLDGGCYDNSGIDAIDDVKGACLVAINAGGVFHVRSRYGIVPMVRDLQRAEALLYRQSTGLRMRQMVERFRAWEDAERSGGEAPDWGRQGVLFGLATTVKACDEWAEGCSEYEDRGDPADLRVQLANVHTSFNRFDPLLCRRLVYRGWWLAGATLSTFHRGLLGSELPSWSPIPGL